MTTYLQVFFVIQMEIKGLSKHREPHLLFADATLSLLPSQ